MYQYVLGIDVSLDAFNSCCLDATGATVSEEKYRADGESLLRFGQELMTLAGGDPSSIAVGIEKIDLPLVDHLISLGIHVYSITPGQSTELRKKRRPSHAKSDRFDAWVIARGLWNPDDSACFHRMQLAPDTVLELRRLSRLDERIKIDFTRSCKQLADELRRYYNQIFELCPSVDLPWVWEILKLAPTPQEAVMLSIDQVKACLRRYRVRRFTAETLLQVLHRTPLPVPAGITAGCRYAVLTAIRFCELLDAERKRVQRDLARLLTVYDSEHDGDATILQSFPGVGVTMSAALIGEAHFALRDYRALSTWSGIAPVTKESGKSSSTRIRRACSARLRDAMYHIAANAQIRLPWARERYKALRAREKDHPTALRILGCQILRRLIAMLRQRTLFDADRLTRGLPATGSPQLAA